MGVDKIRITSASGYGDLSISNFKGEAAIGYDQGDVILLTGIDASQVQSSWFIYG